MFCFSVAVSFYILLNNPLIFVLKKEVKTAVCLKK